MSPAERISQAFLQLDFALKLVCYFERRDVVAGTGDVGLGQRFCAVVEKAVNDMGSKFPTAVECGEGTRQGGSRGFSVNGGASWLRCTRRLRLQGHPSSLRIPFSELSTGTQNR
jgi:hypothetical protein